MSQANSTSAIFYAFSANLGIAIAKTGAALWTGSGSLIAEAIHSYADCGNQVLLFIGMKRSAKTATGKHPMGYGRESYLWSMMVALILFSVGGIFSIHEGWLRYQSPEPVENVEVALIILAIAVVMEGFSLKGALTVMEEERGTQTLWQWFKATHSSELMVVTGEDIAALLGLIVAFIMLSLTIITGNSLYDALGSIIIGVLLVIVAILIGREIYSLLLGESAPEIQTEVKNFLEQQPQVIGVRNIWAVNHGNAVMLAIKVEFKPDLLVSEAVTHINAMEVQIKLNHPRIQWIFFELDNAD